MPSYIGTGIPKSLVTTSNAFDSRFAASMQVPITAATKALTPTPGDPWENNATPQQGDANADLCMGFLRGHPDGQVDGVGVTEAEIATGTGLAGAAVTTAMGLLATSVYAVDLGGGVWRLTSGGAVAAMASMMPSGDVKVRAKAKKAAAKAKKAAEVIKEIAEKVTKSEPEPDEDE